MRISDGPDRGAYSHPKFVRGKPLMSTTMRRTKIKGNASSAKWRECEGRPRRYAERAWEMVEEHF